MQRGSNSHHVVRGTAGAVQGSDLMCMGASFTVELPSSSPPKCIVGDTFLKNVYSVFRFQPPAVGFAQLSSLALGMNDADGPPPTPTIGFANLVSTNGTSSGAGPRWEVGGWRWGAFSCC